MATKPEGYGEFRRGWPIVLSALLGIGLGLSPVPFYTLGSFAPHLAQDFKWGFGQIMGGVPVSTMVVIVSGPLIGLLSDRYGVRRVALTSIVLFGLAFMSFSLNNGSLPLYYLTWGVVAAAGAGTLPITWTRAINNAFDVRKGLALGLSLLGTGLFGYLVKPFAAAMIASYGWRGAYVAIGALPLLIAFPVAYFGFHDVGDRGPAKDRRQAMAEARRVTPGLTLIEALRDWRFWVIAIAFVPMAFAIGGPIPNMENILKSDGLPAGEIVGLASLIGLSVIGGRVIGGWLMDRIWAPAVACVLIGAPALACWLLSSGHLDHATAAASIVLIGLAAGAEFDLMAYLVARYFGMKSYSTIYGILYGFFAAGSGVGPVVYGLAFDKSHSYSGPLLLSAAFFVGGVLMLLTLGRYRAFQPIPAIIG